MTGTTKVELVLTFLGRVFTSVWINADLLYRYTADERPQVTFPCALLTWYSSATFKSICAIVVAVIEPLANGSLHLAVTAPPLALVCT